MRAPSMRLLAVAAVGLLGFLGAAPMACADTIADPQIFICQSCTSPPGGDPDVILSPASFNVGVAGSFTLQNPLLIIVGVYDGNGTPTISFAGGVSTATLGTYGLTANMATFTTGDAFAALGLSAGGSESFTNWSGADTLFGFAAPTSFTLYAFALNTNLTSGSPITIDESGAALGSFIIAYACQDGTGSSTGCATNGDIGQTVFTNTGFIDGVPEPSYLTMLACGLGLVALAGFCRKRRRVAA